MTKTRSVAGMSLSGGRKENFFFCVFEHYQDEDRWVLSSLKQVKDETNLNQDDIITNWIEASSITQLIVDFPLTKPLCQSCNLTCPGSESCHHPDVVSVRKSIEDLLEEDKKRVSENPKRYEQERIEDEMVNYSQSPLDKETFDHILSKAFKRKLKKGFIPYWNRPLDFWIWKNYYDQLLKLFNISYDSFGNISLMLMHKFEYLSKHFPVSLTLFESYIPLVLIELYRAKVISAKHIQELQSIDVTTLARVRIIRAIEKHYNIFIYNKDLELMTRNQKAFDSFLLTIAGKSLLESNIQKVPGYSSKLIVPALS